MLRFSLTATEHGGDDSVEVFVRESYPKILRYCFLKIGDRHEAEDVCQETFLKYFKSYGNSNMGEKAMALLYKIATHNCVDLYRKSKPVYIDSPDLVDIATEEMGFHFSESNFVLTDMLSQLPPKSQELIVLRYSNDLTIKQIADVLSIPLRTAQTRLNTAHKQVAKILKEDGHE